MLARKEQGSNSDTDVTKHTNPTNSDQPIWFEDVLKQELEELKQRREVAGIPEGSSSSNSENEKAPKEGAEPSDKNAVDKNSLVGLTLSGGGLRAATFSLGIIQSMRANGLLRYFDYITSVSGGGYAAGYLATQTTRAARLSNANEKTKSDPKPGKPCYHDLDKFGAFIKQPITNDSEKKDQETEGVATPSAQGTKVKANPKLPQKDESTISHSIEDERFDRRGWLSENDFFVFRDCGKYLARPWEFTANYILSTLPVLLMFACGLAACAAFTAICYRCFDFPIARDVITIGTRRVSEVLVAFLPAIGLASLWVVVKVALIAAGPRQPQEIVNTEDEGQKEFARDIQTTRSKRENNINPIRPLALAGIFVFSISWFFMVNPFNKGNFYTLITSQFLCSQIVILSLYLSFFTKNPSLLKMPRLLRLVAFVGVALLITAAGHVLLKYFPSPSWIMEPGSLNDWTLALVTLMSPIGALIPAFTIMILYIRHEFPQFQGGRMWRGWNGGAVAFILPLAGIFVFACLYFTDLESNPIFLFEKATNSADLLVKETDLLIVCAIGVTILLSVHWLYLGSLKFADYLFRLTLISIPAALVICITNGILDLVFLSDLLKTSNLPVMGQESLQQPLMIYVFLATLALTQYRRLLRSQRPGASIGERLILRMVLTGVIFGIPLLMFGSIAQENFSGYATHRDPQFHESDISFANLAEWWNEESAQGGFSGADLFSSVKPIKDEKGTEVNLNDKLNTYLKHQQSNRKEMFGKPGWEENSRGWTSPKTGMLARLAISLGVSKSHRNLHKEYVKDPSTGLASLRKERKNISDLLSNRLGDSQITHRLGDVILVRAAGADENKRIDLTKVQKYLFETALEEMGKIRTKHDNKEQTAFRQYYAQAIEHLKTSKSNCSLFRVDAPHGSTHNDQFWSDEIPDTTNDNGEERLANFNRLLLERLYPHVFLRSTRISTPVVVQHDQTSRCYLFIVTSIAFGALFLLLPMNVLSPMHQFYREKIRDEFLQTNADETDRQAYAMHELAEAINIGGPIHLFVADLRLGVPLPIDGNSKNDSPLARTRRYNHPYIYSPFHIGSPAIGYRNAKDGSRHVGVDDAVTVSGAAVNPTALATGALRWILTAFNLRLGEWIFHDEMIKHVGNKAESKQQVRAKRKGQTPRKHHKQTIFKNDFIGPAPHHILTEWSRPWVNDDGNNREQFAGTNRTKDPLWWEHWTAGSISDGGFIDFLGIDELLRRRCRILVVVDSSINSGDLEFSVLGEAVRKARLDHGCEILDIDDDKPLDIERLERNDESLTAQHIILGRVLYPKRHTQDSEESEHHEGLLVYVQMTRTGDENVDVTQFARAVPSFPDHPTSDQFFDEAMVEAYRSLGKHIGDAICAGLPNHSLLERAQRNSSDSPMFLNVEELTDALIESYRIDCREIRVDRRDDLRRMPMNSNSDIFNSSIKLPELYPKEIRCLFEGQERTKEYLGTNKDPNFVNYRLNEERFLRLYESDPNLQYRVKRTINSAVHADWNLYEDQDLKARNERFSMGTEPCQLSAYVVACHDFCLVQSASGDWSDNYISVENDSMRVSDGRDLLVGEDRFQAGGRYELLSACVAISTAMKALHSIDNEKQQKNRKLSSETYDIETRLLRRSAVAISDAVFRYRGAETTVMFLDFLLAPLTPEDLEFNVPPSEPDENSISTLNIEIFNLRTLINKINLQQKSQTPKKDTDGNQFDPTVRKSRK